MKNSENTANNSILKAQELANTFAIQEGRRPRILLSSLNTKTRDFELNYIASSYSDMGFDVDLAPPFKSVKALSKQAIENDVHALYLTGLIQDEFNRVSEVINALYNYDRDDILIVVDANRVSEKDRNTLFNYGVHILINPEEESKAIAIKLLTFLIA